MPRHARLDVPGTLHHVMVRGVEGSNVFQDEDRQDFGERIRSLVFEGPHIAVPSIYDGVEERFLTIGLFKGRWVTVVYTTLMPTGRTQVRKD